MILILLTDAEADAIRSPTLKPRPIAAGPHAGKHALGPEVLSDPTHAEAWLALNAATQADVDVAAAWPEPGL